jgi:hypothetical protein
MNTSIGIKKESSLHRDLKKTYSFRTEVQLEGFVCDGVAKDGSIIEVQTGSFAPLKKKLQSLAASNDNSRIHIIHPVALSTVIEIYNEEGELLRRRKSPKRKSAWHLFEALVYAPELALLPNIVIEVALVRVLDYRITDGKGSWRRGGISLKDKFMNGLEGFVVFENLYDYLQFVPFAKNEIWTTRMLSRKGGINMRLAGMAAYTLDKIGITERIGKDGNSFLYRRKI